MSIRADELLGALIDVDDDRCTFVPLRAPARAVKPTSVPLDFGATLDGRCPCGRRAVDRGLCNQRRCRGDA